MRDPQQLTEEERTVLELLAQGFSNIEIAGKLAISPVQTSLVTSDLLRKFRARDKTELIRVAQEKGYLSPNYAAPEGTMSKMCWFCGTRPAEYTAVDEVKMNLLVSRERIGNTIRSVWQKASVNVPRCAECQSAHKQATRYLLVGVSAGAIVSGAVGVVVGLGVNATPQYEGGTLIFLLAFFAGVAALFGAVIGMFTGQRIGEALALRPKSIKSIDAHATFPSVAEMIQQGWKIGERPD